METGRADVVYDPRISRGMLGSLAGAINGAAIARKTSFLKNRMGEQIFSKAIQVTDDPNRRRGLGSRPFDGEGVASAPLTLIKDGVLQTWLLDSAAARELGLTTNGRAARGGSSTHPSTTNLTMLPGERSPADLIANIDYGLYVTELIGHGANLITGDYSRGAAGFLIEKGELTHPVSEITIAGNLKEMFASLVAANDLEYKYGTNAPTILVPGLTIAGR
jgi:PmbA protein